MAKLLKIVNDVYFIGRRLKNIDKSYEVYYNCDNNSYEVHSSAQAKNSYCFKVPYDKLDSRTLDYAVKTRRENLDKLIEEIEKDNLRMEQKNILQQVNLLKEMLWKLKMLL